MKRALLIDGDIVAYKAAFHTERPINWGDGTWGLSADEEEAGTYADNLIESWAEDLSADRVIVCLSDPKENWRKEILPTYKAPRGNVRKPVLLDWLRNDYMEGNYETFRRPTLEADDVMGILSTATNGAGLKGFERIIVSEDKDMKTIPGLLLNPRDLKGGIKAVDALQHITVQDADASHWMQTLCGDQVDNYTGCPGVGEKTATKILAAAWETGTSLWAAIVETYAKRDLDEDFALTQARVARICRASDYDFKRKEVILWNP